MTDLEWIDRYGITFVAVSVIWYVLRQERVTVSLVVGIVFAILLVDGYRILQTIDPGSAND